MMGQCFQLREPGVLAEMPSECQLTIAAALAISQAAQTRARGRDVRNFLRVRVFQDLVAHVGDQLRPLFRSGGRKSIRQCLHERNQCVLLCIR
jgi:hypothetical protein